MPNEQYKTIQILLYNHKLTFPTCMNMIYPVTELFKTSQLPCFDIEYIAQGETEYIDK